MASKRHMKFAEASVKNICLDVSPISLCPMACQYLEFLKLLKVLQKCLTFMKMLFSA